MLFIGANCKLMKDAGLKEVWSTIYKNNSLPKTMNGKTYRRWLTACLHRNSAFHVTLL